MSVRVRISSISRGLGVSLLERVAASCPGAVTLLTTQYRCSTLYNTIQYSTNFPVQEPRRHQWVEQ